MFARATRGPVLAAVGDACCVVLAILATVGMTIPTLFPLGAAWRTNHSRSDSSETVTPNTRSDSAIIRTEVPALRSFMRIALYGSSMSDFLVFPLFASAIKAASFWLSGGLLLGIGWEHAGLSLGKAKGKAGELLGDFLSASRLDDGVSLKQPGELC